jgi:signal transduction histidine kinase
MLLEENHLEKFVDAFPKMEELLECGFYVYSFSSKELIWSRGMYSILGIEPYSIPPSFEYFCRFVAKEDREELIRTVSEARRKRETYRAEFSLVNSQGVFKRLYAESSIKTVNGEPVEYNGILKDQTESYLCKKALEQKVKQLDKSNQNLQEFVYVASHDLQEPLRKISTFAGRLASRHAELLGDEGHMYLGRITKSTSNMQQLLHDLLNFSRLSSAERKFETTDLNQCLIDALNLLEVNIEETRATIAADHLPTVEAYPSQVTQLFTNLISNAIKFRKPGVRPFIRVNARRVTGASETLSSQTFAEINFHDNAIGFEEEYTDKIFQLFQRLNGRSEYSGSGIGLSICKKIADNHHGLIYARSKPGEGSVFTILLPESQG